MTSNDSKARDAAIWLLKRGLVTPSEAAQLAGTSRQLVNYWLNVEGVDAIGARAKYIKRLWATRQKSW